VTSAHANVEALSELLNFRGARRITLSPLRRRKPPPVVTHCRRAAGADRILGLVRHNMEAAAGSHGQVELCARVARCGRAQRIQLRHEGGHQRLVGSELVQRPAEILFGAVDVACNFDDSRLAQLADVLARALWRKLQEVEDIGGVHRAEG